MTIRDIVVHIDSSPASAARLQTALRIARDHTAKLTGLYVIPTYEIPVYAEVSVGPEILEQGTQALREKGEETRARLQGVVDQSSVSFVWRVLEDDLIPSLVRYTRATDLMILGQGDEDRRDDLSAGAADRVVLEAGAPILVVPRGGWDQTVGRRVLIAWNGSRESARAVRDSIHLIGNADDVEVLWIGARSEELSLAMGAEIVDYLVRHDIAAKLGTVTGKDRDAGSVLLERAQTTDRDVLVMGGYGHSRFREIILGGATHQILRDSAIPVLMSH